MKYLILLFGVLCGSTAVVMIKASTVDAAALAALRQLVAVVVLLPVFAVMVRRYGRDAAWASVKVSVAPGLLLGLHFISWNIGARMTLAANAALMVNLAPVVMPFFLIAFLREKLNGREVWGTLVAMLGVAILAIGDFRVSLSTLGGDVVCFGSMLCYTLYLVCARANLRKTALWLYVVPVYAIGGIFSLLVSCFFVNPFGPYGPRDLALILGLGIVPTVAGHTAYNYSMKVIRGQVVSIVNLCQFAFVGMQAYVFLGEKPPAASYAAAVLVVTGAVVAVVAKRNGDS